MSGLKRAINAGSTFCGAQVSVGLRVPANAIATNKDVGVPTKMSMNVRHRVVSPACIAERTASLEIRLKL